MVKGAQTALLARVVAGRCREYVKWVGAEAKQRQSKTDRVEILSTTKCDAAVERATHCHHSV